MKKSLFWIISASALLCASATAGTPGNLDDLVGARASSGEAALEDRGYRFIKSEKGDDRIWANWWNGSTKTCLTVVTLDGRYDSITDSPAFDCNQSDGGDSGGGHKHPHNFQDLVGARGSAVDPRMEESGFHVVDSFQGSDTVANWWFSPKTAECVMISVSDGRVTEVTRAPGYPACKVNR